MNRDSFTFKKKIIKKKSNFVFQERKEKTEKADSSNGIFYLAGRSFLDKDGNNPNRKDLFLQKSTQIPNLSPLTKIKIK